VVAGEQKLADAFISAGLLPGRADIAGYIDRRYNSAMSQRATERTNAVPR
jgi:hypothetical protein